MPTLKNQARLVLATNNKHKVSEIKSILRNCRISIPILTLKDFPKRRPVVENKSTLEGNAIKKAKEVARFTKCLALADDTGLFIKALKGKPGIYSARFAGPKCDFNDNNRKVLRLLKDMPPKKRGATFRCVAALANPKGRIFFIEGRLHGQILEEQRGKNGFGYDPIFWVPSLRKTLAQISSKQKNAISHRARAFRKVPSLLKRALKTL